MNQHEQLVELLDVLHEQTAYLEEYGHLLDEGVLSSLKRGIQGVVRRVSGAEKWAREMDALAQKSIAAQERKAKEAARGPKKIPSADELEAERDKLIDRVREQIKKNFKAIRAAQKGDVSAKDAPWMKKGGGWRGEAKRQQQQQNYMKGLQRQQDRLLGLSSRIRKTFGTEIEKLRAKAEKKREATQKRETKPVAPPPTAEKPPQRQAEPSVAKPKAAPPKKNKPGPATPKEKTDLVRELQRRKRYEPGTERTWTTRGGPRTVVKDRQHNWIWKDTGKLARRASGSGTGKVRDPEALATWIGRRVGGLE